MFASVIFPLGAAAGVISGITSAIGGNILTILVVFAFMVGLSIVMAMIDIHNENKWLTNYGKRWK